MIDVNKTLKRPSDDLGKPQNGEISRYILERIKCIDVMTDIRRTFWAQIIQVVYEITQYLIVYIFNNCREFWIFEIVFIHMT